MSENETFKYFKFKYILGDSILGKSKKNISLLDMNTNFYSDRGFVDL